MLHVMSLSIDEASEVKHHAARFVTLAADGCVGMLQC